MKELQAYTKETLAAIIDHTNLKPTATQPDIKKLCEEAVQYGFASVCINPCHVSYANEIINNFSSEKKETDVMTNSNSSQGNPISNKRPAICTVIGFPLGATSTASKAAETAIAIKHGANEIDMVINIGAVKESRWDYVLKDIHAVVEAANNAIVKVILETCYLTEKEIVSSCDCAVHAGAKFVKTSTGFGTPGLDFNGDEIPSGATCKNVALMRKVVGPEIGVKAAGGIRDKETVIALIQAGASRIGTSSGIKIIS